MRGRNTHARVAACQRRRCPAGQRWVLPSLRCEVETGFGAARGTVRPVLALDPHRGGVAVGQPGNMDSVVCFERVPAWSVVWVLAGDIGECRGWLLCSSSA
jgi:hypothetical protein